MSPSEYNITYLVERLGALMDIGENIMNYCTILKNHEFIDYLPCTTALGKSIGDLHSFHILIINREIRIDTALRFIKLIAKDLHSVSKVCNFEKVYF